MMKLYKIVIEFEDVVAEKFVVAYSEKEALDFVEKELTEEVRHNADIRVEDKWGLRRGILFTTYYV